MVENLNSEFIKMLKQLQDSQNSIESLSTWCLENHKHYKSIISIWSIAIRKEKIKKRLIFFYLANHVIQYSKKKNYKFVSRWKTPIKNAIPYVRDESIQLEISRIIKIWDERRIYDVSYLINLTLSLVKPVQKLKPTNPVQEIQMNNNNKSSTYTTSSYETYKHTPMSSSHQFMTSEFSINMVPPTNLSSLVNKNTMPAIHVPQTAWGVTIHSDRTTNDPPASPFHHEKIYQNNHIISKTHGVPIIDHCVLLSKIKVEDETVSPETIIETSGIDHRNLNSSTHSSDMNLLTGSVDFDCQTLSSIPMPPSPLPSNLFIKAISSPLKDNVQCVDMDLSDNDEESKSNHDQKHPILIQPPLPPMPFSQQNAPGVIYPWIQPSKPWNNGEHNFNENQWNIKQFDQRKYPNQLEEDRKFSNLVHNQPQSLWPQHVQRIQSSEDFRPKWVKRVSIFAPRDPRNFIPYSKPTSY